MRVVRRCGKGHGGPGLDWPSRLPNRVWGAATAACPIREVQSEAALRARAASAWLPSLAACSALTPWSVSTARSLSSIASTVNLTNGRGTHHGNYRSMGCKDPPPPPPRAFGWVPAQRSLSLFLHAWAVEQGHFSSILSVSNVLATCSSSHLFRHASAQQDFRAVDAVGDDLL